ncbi:branched-chain amino acid aminotransferase [Robertkochia marina]|uniref:Branched-chain-amino-acid aminotransferase n=1 Tax=Robertkochia marina TaxID=1227945 RepID=A0A4S3M080_9FLAO|nr:branched-chain amino acid aminotransferase [Robertkochia marina]THD67353.1 branched-chain amino acid aminotransferase [Robertkochia marina]TRZ43009.1 branched-chain amino acid aminotransferase [Robertkochia marina]
MTKETIQDIHVEKAASTRINEVDFNNLTFGSVFTDHMFECDFKDGEWKNPTVKPYQPLTLDPSARVFHYGQAVFEGMKAYRDDNDETWLFRPDENFNRINKSCARLAMPEFPESYFFDGLKTLLDLDKDWIKKGFGNSLYIRPFVIATQSGVMASPANAYKFIIICSPAQSYYGGEVRVKIADHYSRAASGGFGYAKAAGNYAGQFYPTNLAKEEGFQQVIWTDANTHEYLEEAGTMNIFFRINDKLVTCPISDCILDGVTRKSVIDMAKDMGIEVEVRPIKVKEVIEAAENDSLKEIFGSGTAAVITPILGFGYKGDKWELPKLDSPYASQIKNKIMEIQYNKAEDKFGWRYKL